ncbi:MAG: methyltransferase family protein [Tepidisphaeraceae bacterium]
MPRDWYWPGICVGLIVALYWGRVLRLVYKTRKRTGHSANLLPPEPVGRVLRIIWYPTVILWIALPLALGFRPIERGVAGLLFTNLAIEWTGVAGSLVAFGATLVCWKKMGKSWRMGINPAETTSLVVSGPYAFVRHPIYALSSLMMLSTLLAVPTPLMALVGVIHMSFLQWEARREEGYLVQIHGSVYEDYMHQVGRFIPKSTRGYRPGASP